MPGLEHATCLPPSTSPAPVPLLIAIASHRPRSLAPQAKELYTLLTENYMEDGDAMFRFDYSVSFLRWALNPPGATPDCMVGVRVAQTRKLVAFISAIPAE